MGVTHAFTSPKADGGDTTLVQPSNWNAAHTLTGNLSAFDGLANASGYLKNDGAGAFSYTTPTAGDVGGEPALGNPLVSGYVLSSTDAGVRSWIAVGGGSFVTLQATSPGTADTGNSNVSGVSYAGSYRSLLPGGASPTSSVQIGTQAPGTSGSLNYAVDSVMIGEGQTIGALGGNVLVGRSARSGDGLTASANNAVIIGYQAIWSGGYGTGGGSSVAIGSLSQIAGGSQVAIGSSANAGSTLGTVCIGASTTASAQFNIVIGYGCTGPNANSINIGGGTGPAANNILIGTPSMTGVKIGPYTIGSSTSALEPALGNPGTSGWVLSSTTGGVRSWIAPGGGSDPWTYLKLAADFPTTSATAVDVTGLGFTPAINSVYQIEGMFLLRTATTTVGPRPGCDWPTAASDGCGTFWTTSSATAQILTNGGIGAAILADVGGLPNNTSSYPGYMQVTLVTGAGTSGNFKIQLASETAGTTVTMKAGSYIRYRTI